MSKTIFVCGACGKTAYQPNDFSDVSCAVNAVECLTDSLKYDDSGRVTYATGVDEATGDRANDKPNPKASKP